MLQKLFHVNICVRDMERSIRFYQDLGFTKVRDFTLDDPSVGDALGLKAKKLRGVFMRLGNDPNSPVLDLVQFIDPPPQGQPYPTLNNIGICRIAFTVDDIDRTYADVQAQ
jgi:catechol 2,3-dioxygenase-like lactoylglutathione lyase family enzyme